MARFYRSFKKRRLMRKRRRFRRAFARRIGTRM